jgi:hypothetical protein
VDGVDKLENFAVGARSQVLQNTVEQGQSDFNLLVVHF